MKTTTGTVLLPWLLLMQVSFIRASDIRQPPSIFSSPPKHYIFKEKEDLQLLCEATGSPTIQYAWYKDDTYLDLNEYGHIYPDPTLPDTGAIVIKEVQYSDEGYYQCFAWNTHGRSASDVLFLQAGTLDMTSGDITTPYHSVAGSSIMIPCDRRESVPDADFTWTTSDGPDGTPAPVVMDRRVNIDKTGNLYFSHVKTEDQATNGFIYRCNIKNTYLDWTVGTSYSSLTVSGSSGPDVAPEIMAWTGEGATVVGLLGQEMRLGCFFSGKGDVTVDWSISSSIILPPHHIKDNYNLELSVNPVQYSDEDTYMCTGSNNVGTNSQEIQVKVEAIPYFEEPEHPGPKNVNASDGDQVVFYCNAMAIPTADVIWYINGEPYQDADLGSRFRLSEDGTVLNISDVCKNCQESGHVSDLMNIQCNASNTHGYAYAEGYLNVLERTEFTTVPPESTNIVIGEGEQIILPCQATTDDSTPLTMDWLHDDEHFANEEGVRVVDNDTHTLYVWTETEAVAHRVMGRYTCVASNGVSVAKADAHLILAGAVTTSSFDLWWIFIIIAVVLIIFIVLLCVLLYMQKNKGADYYVDEKERAEGHNPEKELEEGGFHDYQRPSEPMPNHAKPVPRGLGTANPAYIASMIDLDMESLGEESLAEYGDIDPMKFNEDGSFIGQYNTITASRQQLHMIADATRMPHESDI